MQVVSLVLCHSLVMGLPNRTFVRALSSRPGNPRPNFRRKEPPESSERWGFAEPQHLVPRPLFFRLSLLPSWSPYELGPVNEKERRPSCRWAAP
jgi:hypothetical protein